MTAPLEIVVYATLRPDGAWVATSDAAELLEIISAAPDGVLVKTIRIKVEAKAPGIATAELVAPAAGKVSALAAE